jgi:enoyl-CoA hydratase/carnithine racemase
VEKWAMDSLVLTEVVGGLGVITLNRPKALNALSLKMVRELYTVLSGCASDAAVLGVLMRGSTASLMARFTFVRAATSASCTKRRSPVIWPLTISSLKSTPSIT